MHRPALAAQIALTLEPIACVAKQGPRPPHVADVALGTPERKQGARREDAVARALGQAARAAGALVRLVVRAHLDQHIGKTKRRARDDPRVGCATARVGDAERPPEQGLGRPRLPGEDLFAATGEVFGRRRGELLVGTGTGAATAELPRAFEMVRDRADRLARARRRCAEPGGDLQMPIGTSRLRQRAVGDVADQRVLPRVLRRPGDAAVRPLVEQAATDETADRAPHRRRVLAHPLEGARPGDGAADGGVVEHTLLLGGQRVQPRRDHKPDRRRDLIDRLGPGQTPGVADQAHGATLDEHPDQLLEE